MKKYNRPEIEALALETIDIIATSGNVAAEEALANMDGVTGDPANGKLTIEEQISTLNTWSW